MALHWSVLNEPSVAALPDDERRAFVAAASKRAFRQRPMILMLLLYGGYVIALGGVSTLAGSTVGAMVVAGVGVLPATILLRLLLNHQIGILARENES